MYNHCPQNGQCFCKEESEPYLGDSSERPWKLLATGFGFAFITLRAPYINVIAKFSCPRQHMLVSPNYLDGAWKKIEVVLQIAEVERGSEL